MEQKCAKEHERVYTPLQEVTKREGLTKTVSWMAEKEYWQLKEYSLRKISVSNGHNIQRDPGFYPMTEARNYLLIHFHHVCQR